ncbi:hypothetical protein WI372_11970 [Gemmatimonadota bacterium DH-20]|uniref:NERD domain-containing protein n=1 Tax=Gaopeijia maritima TaxID=3119007 RepID=A0ABU9EAK9_9BACT
MAVTLGAGDLLEHEATLDEVVALLGSYSLGEVVEFCGRVSSVLYSVGNQDQIRGQSAIIDAVLGSGSRLSHRFLELREQHMRDGAAEAVIFHHIQLLTALKIAFLTLPPSFDREAGRPLNEMVAALLLISDLLTSLPEEFQALGRNDRVGRERRILYVLANGLFHRSRSGIQDFVRSYDLLMGGNEPSHRERVRRATGYDPEQYWFALIGLHAYFASIDEGTLANRPAVISRQNHFSRNLQLSQEESCELVDLVSAPVEMLQAEIRSSYSLSNLRPFHLTPIARHPLVSFNDDAVCASMHLLSARITTGLYHVHLDRGTFTPDERGRYQQELGDRFGEHVTGVLRDLYPDTTRRLVDDDALRSAMGDGARRADCLCLFGDRVLVVEAKASPFPADVRAGLDFTALADKVDQVFVEGMRQIEATVNWVRTSRESELDVPTSATFFPLVVTLDDLPMNPWLYEFIEDRLRAAGLWRSFPSAPFQAMDIDELEMMPGIIEASGRSLVELIALKCASGSKHVSFKSFFAESYPEWVEASTPRSRTSERFDELSSELLAHFRRLRREDG